MTGRCRSILLMLLLLALAGAAYAQVPPKYTKNPDYYREYLSLKEKAEWLVAAWKEPTATMQAEVAKVQEWIKAGRPDTEPRDVPEALRYLGLQDYEVERLAPKGDGAIRTALAKAFVSDASWDPVFETVLTIAGPEYKDRVEAIQALQLLVDAEKVLDADYPVAYEAARAIFMERIDDPRLGVGYIALSGLMALPGSYRTPNMTDKFIALLESEEQVVVAEAARALGEVGDKRAVRPLMEKFLAIPEDENPPTSNEEGSSPPPLNQARLAIATAVGKITGQNWAFASQRNKAAVLAQYKSLTDWWDANNSNYQ